MKNQEESPTSPTIPLQATDLTTISATITQGCRATVSHADAAETAISVCNRYENSRADCHTNLPDKRAANRRKHRPTDIWLRGTVWQFRVRPRRAGTEPPKNAIDDPPIVNARHAARVCRQVRLDLRKLFVRPPKLIPIHRCFLSEAVNHKPLITRTILWVQTLMLLKNVDEPGAAQTAIVLQRGPCPRHLARAGGAAQLPNQFGDLRQPGGAQGMTLG